MHRRDAASHKEAAETATRRASFWESEAAEARSAAAAANARAEDAFSEAATARSERDEPIPCRKMMTLTATLTLTLP